jgi:NADH-quinone oxidoreductase subunit J
MSAEAIVFDILAVIAVIAAAGVVLARNPVHSAVSLVVSFINVAAVYLILRAEFLAAVQIIVYTGAILVLVLFVVMLVHQEDLPEFHGGRPVQQLLGFLLGLALFGEVAAAILTRTAVGQPGPWTPEAVQAVGGNTQAIGQVLYSGYVLPIQTTALVLLVATIGALVLARPEIPRLRVQVPRQVFTISLGHPRGTDEELPEEVAALGPGYIKPEAGERELIMAKSGDEFVDQPVWGERQKR